MIVNFEKQLKDRKGFGNNCPNQPSFEIIRKLVPLFDDENFQIGSVHYTVQIMCWAPKVVPTSKATGNDEKLCVESPVLVSRIIESGEGADKDPMSIDGCEQTADSPTDDSSKLSTVLVHKEDTALLDRDINGCVGSANGIKSIKNYVHLDDLLNLDGSFRYRNSTFFFEVQLFCQRTSGHTREVERRQLRCSNQ